MKKARPNKGPGGRIYADADGGWYYLTEILENGNEKRIASSNALFHVQESAARFSCGKKGLRIRLGNILLVDGRTHKAIAFYKKGEGLQEGWQEKDGSRAAARLEAYRNHRSLIDQDSPAQNKNAQQELGTS